MSAVVDGRPYGDDADSLRRAFMDLGMLSEDDAQRIDPPPPARVLSLCA